MKRITRLRGPSPAVIIAIAALIAALTGSAYAGSKIGFTDLSKGAKSKTEGIGQLTYVSTTNSVPPTGAAGATVLATCPPGKFPVGGGIRVLNDANMIVNDSHPISGGWAGTVFNGGSTTNAVVSVACATSRSVSGFLQTTSSEKLP